MFNLRDVSQILKGLFQVVLLYGRGVYSERSYILIELLKFLAVHRLHLGLFKTLH
jgi:hypothetical protein